MQETSNLALPSALTKLGTFSDATEMMISKLPAPALLASTVQGNKLQYNMCRSRCKYLFPI